MDFTIWHAACLIVWVIFGAMASHVASYKKAENEGFWFGVLLGPFGVIAAGFLDKRPQCPRCGGRLNDRVNCGDFGTVFNRAMEFIQPNLEAPFEEFDDETDGGYPVCQHCGTSLDWTRGKPLTPEMVESLRKWRESAPTHAERESEPAHAEHKSAPPLPEYDGRPKFDEWGNPVGGDKQEGEPEPTAVN